MALLRSLIENLVSIEMRRQLPLAQLAWLVGMIGGRTNFTPQDYLMPYATPDVGAPAWVRQDLKAGELINEAPPALVDAIRSW